MGSKRVEAAKVVSFLKETEKTCTPQAPGLFHRTQAWVLWEKA
ncbi:uncharacterized protein PGTG_00823 [Puccinia graminis f. sp. tritici CRL 75-36-700-3]|uniref:Uncharacterized protein n=1 Tax=Puccinia graminis f. sp. tritici (strain CRL 75-36-700-3 / race SCCL) TaxID=418459 RepID=E3JTS5_PUCGT|nr:uncharacterized protein PGTG_00823 [Puccinia graminis f. sp. tritici CRL 75-36-700-3]EFP75492.1 hypothetical protein PGTG_00823 [Puccinia graminis f. sp. tritici CRL 75-36-700-3]